MSTALLPSGVDRKLQFFRRPFFLAIILLSATVAHPAVGADLPAAAIASHAPQRPLPVASQRLLPPGNIHVVDSTRGNDSGPGNADSPWRTLDHALAQLPDGGVLCLRGGVYYTHTVVHTAASKAHRLVIRSWPGELAILDGSEPDFALHPDTAWEPATDGVPGEFRSIKVYPLGANKSKASDDGDGQVRVMGRFIDSMLPLQGYLFHGDLQSDNPWWNLTGKGGSEGNVYCGPGVWQSGKTGRIYCRLAPTALPGLGDDNYTGVADPRRTTLCISTTAAGSVLTLDGARHVVLQDIIIRGGTTGVLSIANCADITLDGVISYGGFSAMHVMDTAGLRVIHSACRGMSAPWMYRGALKYRSVEARLFSASGHMPTGADNRDFELAYSEFTDSEDGVFLGNVHGVRFHHNLLENTRDDGLFVTSPTGYDGHVTGGDFKIWQNRFASCLTTFAFGVGHGRQLTLPDRVQTSDGIWITRNVLDFRRPVHYQWPHGSDDKQDPEYRGRFGGDHGSPAWEPMWVYHNTMIGGEIFRTDFGNSGLGQAMGKGTTRQVLNNLLCVDVGAPGTTVPADPHFTASGNLLWSFDPKIPSDPAAWSAKLAKSSAKAAADNHVLDPRFAQYSTDWRVGADLRLQAESPAVNKGAAIPAEWFDPLRAKDAGAPDIGAVPHGTDAWRIGVHGRLDVFGRTVADISAPLPAFDWAFVDDHPDHGVRADSPRAIIVRGYPSWDTPILQYLLRRRGAIVEVRNQEHFPLTAKSLAGAKLLIYDGSLTRAKVEPDTLSAEDIAALEGWLQAGGTLMLCSQRTDIFKSDAGHEFLSRHFGNAPRATPGALAIPSPGDPWVVPLHGTPPAWLSVKGGSPVWSNKGEAVITAGPGFAMLWKTSVGSGHIYYLGWSVGSHLTDNRRGSTAEKDAAILEQVRVLEAMLDGWIRSK